MVKDAGEIGALTEAQRIAGIGMDRARELLRPGVTAQEIATEATYAMMRAGAEATSTPLFVNFGIETCMLHGRLSPAPLQRGELVLVDLTPQVEGYCANLARTFVLGQPDPRQAELLTTYGEIVADVRAAMRPGVTTAQLDGKAREACTRHGMAEYQVYGIGHGIGLRFEEPPASTIIPPHRNLPLVEGMAVTIGHTVLAIPGFGGVRSEDIYRLTASGPEILVDYPVDPVDPRLRLGPEGVTPAPMGSGSCRSPGLGLHREPVRPPGGGADDKRQGVTMARSGSGASSTAISRASTDASPSVLPASRPGRPELVVRMVTSAPSTDASRCTGTPLRRSSRKLVPTSVRATPMESRRGPRVPSAARTTQGSSRPVCAHHARAEHGSCARSRSVATSLTPSPAERPAARVAVVLRSLLAVTRS